jgi:hypothetical protein
MDYKVEYKKLILIAKKENRTKNQGIYYEKHHIIPEFMFKNRKRKGPSGHMEGDPNNKNNIVLLTFKEHFMAHYYLYKILQNSRYEFSAGSALIFFFTKAINNKHARWQSIDFTDHEFLEEMSKLREIGIKSISCSRKGKMPVVDAKTRISIGSVPIDHPKVLSGEWIHHSKGRPGKKQPEGYGRGSSNKNYKEMTAERKLRIYYLIPQCIEDNHFKVGKFLSFLKKEFVEFKKISTVWIKNNFGSYKNLIEEYNKQHGTCYQYARYHRSKKQKKLISDNLKNILKNNNS